MQSNCASAVANVLAPSLRVIDPVLVNSPIHTNCRISAIIPVRNEADSLEATLAALYRQVDLQGHPLDLSTYEVILLANNCTDASAAVAQQFGRQHPQFALHVVEKTFAPADAYVGRVRQVLMDEAHRRLISLGRPRGIIASTDGDTRVSPTWLAAIQHEIDLGADGVSGRIMTAAPDRAQLDPYTRVCYLRAIGYGYLGVALEALIDPDPFDRLPRHHQHCGASLAVTAEMYAKAGGMPPVRTPEDVAFYRSLVRIDARFRHSPLVWVKTSARQQGRTSNGMANQLHEWATMGHRQQPYLVESAMSIETRLRYRRQLRCLWQKIQQSPVASITQQAEIRQLADALQVDRKWLSEELHQSRFGGLQERIELCQSEINWNLPEDLVPIEQAMSDLRRRISEIRQDVKLSRSRSRMTKNALEHQCDIDHCGC